MRHTFATFYYNYTKNIKKVSKKLGHPKTANTDKYVDVAENLEEQFDGKNLFNIALKLHNIFDVGGKQKTTGYFGLPQKKPSNESNFSEKKVMGLAGLTTVYWRKNFGLSTKKHLNSKFSSFLTKIFFFSFFFIFIAL